MKNNEKIMKNNKKIMYKMYKKKIKKFILNIITNKIKNIWKINLIYIFKYISLIIISQISIENTNFILNATNGEKCEIILGTALIMWMLYAGYKCVDLEDDKWDYYYKKKRIQEKNPEEDLENNPVLLKKLEEIKITRHFHGSHKELVPWSVFHAVK